MLGSGSFGKAHQVHKTLNNTEHNTFHILIPWESMIILKISRKFSDDSFCHFNVLLTPGREELLSPYPYTSDTESPPLQQQCLTVVYSSYSDQKKFIACFCFPQVGFFFLFSVLASHHWMYCPGNQAPQLQGAAILPSLPGSYWEVPKDSKESKDWPEISLSVISRHGVV